MPLSGADVLTTYHPPDVLTKLDNGHKEKEPNEIWYKKYNFRWAVIFLVIILHTTTPYVLVTFPYIEKYKTFLWSVFLFNCGLFGVTAGVHRLWSHRSFKANLPLQTLLAICYTLSLLMPIKKWVKIHHTHHKYSDTDVDPHNARKGLFYSHIGWVLVRPSQQLLDTYKTVDLTHIIENPVISFFDRHFWKYSAILTVMSIAIPVYCWNEEWYYAFVSQLARFVLGFNVVLSVNSLAHTFVDRPFNKSILPRDSGLVSFLTNGEGWHNYHHTFPYDYRTPEFIGLRYDVTAKVIELFEKIGWAYDLRKPNDDHVKRAIKNKGDNLLQSLSKFVD